MTRKRKRHPAAERTWPVQPTNVPAEKRRQADSERPNAKLRGDDPSTVEHAVLSQYFPCLFRLRDYFLHLLSSWSMESHNARTKYANLKNYVSDGTPESAEVSELLDTAIVCLPCDPSRNEIQSSFRDNDLSVLTNIAGEGGLELCQIELVGLVIELLFERTFPRRPTSILTRGFDPSKKKFNAQGGGTKRFGMKIIMKIPNLLVDRLRSSAWNKLQEIVGEKAMLALLLMQGSEDGALFAQVPLAPDGLTATGKCYVQMTGDPLCDRKKLPRDDAPPITNRRCPLKKRGLPLAESTPPAKKRKIKQSNKNRQLSGKTEKEGSPTDPETMGNSGFLRKPGGISFYRGRIFYAKPALNREGEVKFGLRHIHALNRFSEHGLRAHRVRMLKYIFPREFGLHNVFTSETNRAETTQTLQDYTVREKEINVLLSQARRKFMPSPGPLNFADSEADTSDGEEQEELMSLLEVEKRENIPKRLRGKVYELVGKLIRNHKRCSYHALLKHYCPVSLVDPGAPDRRPAIPKAIESVDETSLMLATQPTTSKRAATISPAKVSPAKSTRRRSSSGSNLVNSDVPEDGFTGFACTNVEVSAFCRAVVKSVFPREFWGSKEHSIRNLRMVETKIEAFVRLRKFESSTLHDVLQDFKNTDFDWLGPSTNQKLTLSDTNKRVSLLSEFFYYLFDSFLIPLIRSHFYATESSANRYRVFYFRQDVWKKLTEPKLCEFKTSMFHELKTAKANDILKKRELGYGTIRLLPKKDGVRMITNLRRRAMEKNPRTGQVALGRNINTILLPIHQVLKYEIGCDASKLGASLFSAGDLHPKLKAFKRYLEGTGILGKDKIYFVKVDVKKCFDTIPNKDLFNFVREMFNKEEEYKTERHAEVTETAGKYGNGTNWRWINKALPAHKYPDLKEKLEMWQDDPKFSLNKNTIFVDLVWQRFFDSKVLEHILDEHLLNNLIKIGKKYYRQKSGIPQGSILSTMLCSLFYANLEEKHLSFTREPTGLLLRLIDDFLFITLSRSHAEKFLNLMHKGFPEYGAFVNTDKSLVNFDVSIGGKIVNRVFQSDGGFPYCGTRICEKTLDVKRDKRKAEANVIEDTLTVEYSRNVGDTMVKKALNYLTRSSRTMYFDTSFNSRRTVLQNLYCSFTEAAMRFYRYGKNLGPKKRPSEPFIISAIDEITELSFLLLNSKKLKPTTAWSQELEANKNSANKAKEYDFNDSFKCVVGKSQIRWLAAAAFHRVYRRKQTLYGSVLSWLEARMNDKKNGKVDRSCRRIPDSRELKEFVDGFKY